MGPRASSPLPPSPAPWGQSAVGTEPGAGMALPGTETQECGVAWGESHDLSTSPPAITRPKIRGLCDPKHEQWREFKGKCMDTQTHSVLAQGCEGQSRSGGGLRSPPL